MKALSSIQFQIGAHGTADPAPLRHYQSERGVSVRTCSEFFFSIVHQTSSLKGTGWEDNPVSVPVALFDVPESLP